MTPLVTTSLNTPIRDLGLEIERSPVQPLIQRLYRELEAKEVSFKPEFYATDGWGCPDEVPVIGIPFYLLDRRLLRTEEEQTGEIEDNHMIMMLLRHEAGHAIESKKVRDATLARNAAQRQVSSELLEKYNKANAAAPDPMIRSPTLRNGGAKGGRARSPSISRSIAAMLRLLRATST